MPTANKLIAEAHRIRALIYGPGKTRKTWWALAAAEAGFRVLMFSGENGHGIVQRLSPEARERVYIIDCADGPMDGFFSVLMAVAFKRGQFAIDETTRRIADRQLPGTTWIDMTAFRNETVVVVDTWTALVQSLVRRFSFENSIDLSDANRVEWDGYRYCGMLATWILDQLRAALHCHYVVIGHATQYEKYKKSPNDPKKQGPLEFSRRQPVSTSNPHGMTISGKFDHVLYFSNSSPKNTWIDTLGDVDHDAGSRALANDRYKWEDLSFATLAQADGMTLPSPAAQPFDFPTTENRVAALGSQSPASAASSTSASAQPVIQPVNAAPITARARPLAQTRPSLLLKR